MTNDFTTAELKLIVQHYYDTVLFHQCKVSKPQVKSVEVSKAPSATGLGGSQTATLHVVSEFKESAETISEKLKRHTTGDRKIEGGK